MSLSLSLSLSLSVWTNTQNVTYLLSVRHELDAAPDILLLLCCSNGISESTMCPLHDPAKQKEKD